MAYRDYDSKAGWIIDEQVATKVMGRSAKCGDLPEYSASLDDCWPVIEEMERRGKHCLILITKGSATVTFFAGPEDNASPVTAETPAMAVCLAALKAVDGK